MLFVVVYILVFYLMVWLYTVSVTINMPRTSFLRIRRRVPGRESNGGGGGVWPTATL
jgi:hypothetical protein